MHSAAGWLRCTTLAPRDPPLKVLERSTEAPEAGLYDFCLSLVPNLS
jgi:hypothetical protein